MIRDKILLYRNLEDLKIRCMACNKMNHVLEDCQLVHFVADREKVLKTYNYPINQKRAFFRRTYYKKKKLVVVKMEKKEEDVLSVNDSTNIFVKINEDKLKEENLMSISYDFNNNVKKKKKFSVNLEEGKNFKM